MVGAEPSLDITYSQMWNDAQVGGPTRPRPFGRIAYLGLCIGSCFHSFESRTLVEMVH